jgi:phenylalanine ammonia-lyase
MPPETIVVCGDRLTTADVGRVARQAARVQITDDAATLRRIDAACTYIADAVREGRPIYGVTSGFGGMAHVAIPSASAAELQDNLIWYHKTAAGQRLSNADVRAAMLLRMNSHLRGASGIRLEVIRRIETFLNANVTPYAYEFGSIGASGDLVPLSYIAGALIGLDPSYTVDFDGEELDAVSALQRLGLSRLHLRPKEGLAMINGTAVMTGIAANVLCDARTLFVLALATHALAIQALGGTNQSFHPFIHALKPHPGQVWSAARMLHLLDGSQLIRDELDGRHDHRMGDLIQDRYSLRCLPQYMGPLVDGLVEITRQIEVEANAATDNPLIDVDAQASYHGGNFLGQYTGMAMDRLRSIVGLLAKHLDVQIALLVAPEFNNGLPACLIGNTARPVNMGLKGLQIAGNSMMPLLTFLGNSIVDHFPTHAEQFNQNINSQGFNAATLARRSIDIFRQYLALGLLFGIQGVDLRTHRQAGHYDARQCLSPATAQLYEAIRIVIDCPPSADRPYLWDDTDRPFDADMARIAADILAGGRIPQAVHDLVNDLEQGAAWSDSLSEK